MPLQVSSGFYSLGGGSHSLDVAFGAEEASGEQQLLNGRRRTQQEQCPPGTYCAVKKTVLFDTMTTRKDASNLPSDSRESHSVITHASLLKSHSLPF